VQRERDTLLALVESITDEIWFADTDGNLTLVNPAVWKGSGALDGEPIEAIAARFEVYRADGTLRPPSDAPPLRALSGETIRDEEETVWMPGAAELRHRLVSGAPVRDRGGAIIGSVCVVRDVTHRVRAEEALRDSVERLRLATAAARIGAFDWNIQTGVNLWTEELEALYGLAPGEFGRTQPAWEQLVHSDDRTNAVALVDTALETGQPVEGEWRVIWADGSVHWITGRFQAYRDDAGRPLRLTGVNVDITRQKAVEEELRRSREDFDRAQAVGQVGSWRLDVRENVLTWSDENYRIFGLPIGTPLTYETFLAAVHPDDRAFVDARWEAGMRGAPYDIEHRLLVEGQVKWVREKAFLEYDVEGELLGGFGITQDVTTRRAAEEALREIEARQAAEQVRASLARDLHDSVSQAIFAAALKAEALELAGEGVDERVVLVAKQMQRLCRGALADLRTMLLELRGEGLEGIAMEQLLRQLVDAAEGRTSARVELAVQESSALPSAVQVAFYRVTQEALNNVARHAGATRAWVEAHLSETEASLEVRDDGRGFAPGESAPGHLGLRSMQERAAEIGADLRVTSVQGQGTCVALRWQEAEPAGR
jgi:PAS domain S-box-containing protein